MDNLIRVYYDAEFTGLHRNTTLVSIAFTTGNPYDYFYAEFTDYDTSQVDEWLQQNVIDNLEFNNVDWCFIGAANSNAVKMKGTSDEIKKRLLTWFQCIAGNSGSKIMVCTDCYAYDWMTLMDLICEDGKALNIPDFLYYIPIDLSTVLYVTGNDPDVSREEFIGEQAVRELQNDHNLNKHNCLWDAFVIRACFRKLAI